MSKIVLSLISVFILTNLLSCKGQNEKNNLTISEDFDKSPPIYYGMPVHISHIDTSPAFKLDSEKLLLTGTVFQSDAKTPAPGIIIYYYQTDQNGKYQHIENESRSMPQNDLGQTHGYIRGWVKSDQNGKYSIYTTRPGTYPSRTEPAHIHLTIIEPNVKEAYYIDNFVFDDDKMLTTQTRINMENRGGSGVLRLVQKGDLKIGERNIILGLNIPDYPKKISSKIESGKSIGEDIISFTPTHAWGADRGSKTCPICKYGWYHGILYFVGNKPNWVEIEQWLQFLESESTKREKFLKVYFIYGNESSYSAKNRQNELERLGKSLKLKHVALTFVPSFSDKGSEIYLNKLDPNVENTFIIYKRSIVIDKFINLKPNLENYNLISNRLDQTINAYYDLPRPK